MRQITKEKFKLLYDYAWTALDEDDDLSYVNPFSLMTTEDRENPDIFLLDMLSRPENFILTCRLLLNKQITLQQAIVLREMWYKPFPILLASRGWSKSFTIALYCLLRATFLQGRKIVITGAGFRQGKTVMNYMNKLWLEAPVLQDLLKGGPFANGLKTGHDRWDFHLGYSLVSTLPIGDGDKIRGERSHDTITDEFGSVPPDIYEQVLGPFSIVASNPIEQIQRQAQIKLLKRYGMLKDSDIPVNAYMGNQQIISGTPGYTFEHFYRYYSNWKKYIQSKKNPKILLEVFGHDVPEGFNPDNFVIIRIPYELTPDGYMDKPSIAKSRAATSSMIFDMEYACIFPKDSDGFFKASLINKSTASAENVVTWRNMGMDINVFTANNYGDKKLKYIYGVDPASEQDNLALVIVELRGDHRRVVHCWTANAEKHKELMRTGQTTEKDYYAYCARKIRDLMKVFPTENIAIDSQGGGTAIASALFSDKNLKEGEQPLLPVIVDGKYKETDDFKGLHILHMINFASQEFTDGANHGLRKALEDKELVFPFFDPVSLMESDDSEDGLESVMWEVEELKQELQSIVVTKTPSGREHFDLPAAKIVGGKKVTKKKDRYSALLMANWIAMQNDRPRSVFESVGGGTPGNMAIIEEKIQVPQWVNKFGYDGGFAIDYGDGYN